MVDRHVSHRLYLRKHHVRLIGWGSRRPVSGRATSRPGRARYGGGHGGGRRDAGRAGAGTAGRRCRAAAGRASWHGAGGHRHTRPAGERPGGAGLRHLHRADPPGDRARLLRRRGRRAAAHGDRRLQRPALRDIALHGRIRVVIRMVRSDPVCLRCPVGQVRDALVRCNRGNGPVWLCRRAPCRLNRSPGRCGQGVMPVSCVAGSRPRAGDGRAPPRPRASGWRTGRVSLGGRHGPSGAARDRGTGRFRGRFRRRRRG